MRCSCSCSSPYFLSCFFSYPSYPSITSRIRKKYVSCTNRNMYLMPSSVHPPHCVQNIPYSLAMRILRICTRELRYQQLKQLLLTRGYCGGMVDAAIAKSRAVPRSEALKVVVKQQQSKRPFFCRLLGSSDLIDRCNPAETLESYNQS